MSPNLKKIIYFSIVAFLSFNKITETSSLDDEEGFRQNSYSPRIICDNNRNQEEALKRSGFYTNIREIYRHTDELTHTNTYKVLIGLELASSPVMKYFLLGGWASCSDLMNIAGRYGLFNSIMKPLLNTIVPKDYQPSVHKIIDMSSIFLSGLHVSLNLQKYAVDYCFGLVGLYLTHETLSHLCWADSYKKEIEAFSYFCFRRLGWFTAAIFDQEIHDFLSYFPNKLLSHMNMGFVFANAEEIKMNHLENQDFINGTLIQDQCPIPQCPPNALDPIACDIQLSWQRARECIKSEDPDTYGQAWHECRSVYKSDIPHYQNAAVFPHLYGPLEPIGGGGENMVYKATINSQRFNVPANSVIAVRVKPSNEKYPLPRVFDAYARLNLLQGGHPVSELYTPVHGAYYGINFTKFEDWSKISTFLYTEMEYVPYSLFDKYDYNDPIPDSALFEICLGEWAEKTVSTLRIADYKGRHFMYKMVDYARIYEIGNKIFLINNPLSPRRVDYDIFSHIPAACPSQLSSSCDAFSMFDNHLSPSLKEAANLHNQNNIFDLFFDYFGKYTISPEQLKKLKKVKYFKVPDEFIPEKYK